jgi:hypothetical protein
VKDLELVVQGGADEVRISIRADYEINSIRLPVELIETLQEALTRCTERLQALKAQSATEAGQP